jgi:hypothetical protein
MAPQLRILRKLMLVDWTEVTQDNTVRIEIVVFRHYLYHFGVSFILLCCGMDHSPINQNFELNKSRKNFITAWKSITKLVIFQSFVAKCCKMRIIWPCEVFSHFRFTNGKLLPLLCVIQNDWKLQTSQGYIIRILQLILGCSFKLWWNFCSGYLRSKFWKSGNHFPFVI